MSTFLTFLAFAIVAVGSVLIGRTGHPLAAVVAGALALAAVATILFVATPTP